MHHAIVRARNREPVFHNDGDRWDYLNLLHRHSRATQTEIHAWVLMSNHVHLLVTVRREGGLAGLLRLANGTYSRDYNRRHGRMGSNWQPHATIKPVVFLDYCVSCHLYIETNPVRAGLVQRPEDYRWSSCRQHMLGTCDGITNDCPWYAALGRSAKRRLNVYQHLMHRYMDKLSRQKELGGADKDRGWITVEADLRIP
ncbi:MAG: transposase [bacterium]|jgi:putative transposase|nr:transposase [bacterium]